MFVLLDTSICVEYARHWTLLQRPCHRNFTTKTMLISMRRPTIKKVETNGVREVHRLALGVAPIERWLSVVSPRRRALIAIPSAPWPCSAYSPIHKTSARGNPHTYKTNQWRENTDGPQNQLPTSTTCSADHTHSRLTVWQTLVHFRGV